MQQSRAREFLWGRMASCGGLATRLPAFCAVFAQAGLICQSAAGLFTCPTKGFGLKAGVEGFWGNRSYLIQNPGANGAWHLV